MKINTEVKAGGQGDQHNEKLESEKKSRNPKTLKTKLRLGKETIRELKDGDLKRVAGGAPTSQCTNGEFCQSDVRLKTDIRDIDNALETVLSLKGHKYEWKKDANTGLAISEGAPLGFLAQEVEKVLPEVVTTNSNGYKAIFYQNITAVLVEGMKEQQQIIDRQRAELEQMKERQEIMDRQLEQLKALVQVQPKVRAAKQF